jgi:hypothetical protein
MDPNEFQKAYGKLVAKAWEDEAFKAELFSDPMKIFKENGIQVPEGIQVHMVENTADTMFLIFPPEPSDELTDSELGSVAGGMCCGPTCAAGCRFP